MLIGRHRLAMVALLFMGSAILLFSCKEKKGGDAGSLDAIMTEQSENLTIVMSENGRKSYIFKAKLLEGYTLGRDPYREFRKGISITTYQDDSLSTENATLVANYAIYYENRKLWEAKGDVVVTKHDGTRLYTQQLFWNSMTKRIYSNVDTKLVTATDELIGEGFESDEDMNEPRFRRWKGKMQVDTEELKAQQNENSDDEEAKKDNSSIEQVAEKSAAKPQPTTPIKSADKPKDTPTTEVSKPSTAREKQLGRKRGQEESAKKSTAKRPTPRTIEPSQPSAGKGRSLPQKSAKLGVHRVDDANLEIQQVQ